MLTATAPATVPADLGPAPPVLSVRQLRFRWTRRRPPCLDVERFEVAAGERVYVHGPSGSGKSTLLGVLGGVLTPDQGAVLARVDDRAIDLSRLASSARDRFRVDHIGFVFQQFNLIPYLGVLENVLLPCRYSPRRRRRAGPDAADAARRLLQALDLSLDLAARPVMQLSVGQQQRVALARALIGRPEIIIADEPTSALDAALQQRFLDLLLRECEASNACLVFVSHDRRLAARFTREVALCDINRAAAPSGETAE